MSDRGDSPPDEGAAPPSSRPPAPSSSSRPGPKLGGAKDPLRSPSAPPPPESVPPVSEDPKIDFTITAELSGEETERLLDWAKQYDHLFDEEATVDQEAEITQAAIATLPMPRDSRPPAVPLRLIAPPMPAPRMPMPSAPGAGSRVSEARVHIAVTPPSEPPPPPATATPVVPPSPSLLHDESAWRSVDRSSRPRIDARAPSPSGEFRRAQRGSPIPKVLLIAVGAALVAGGIYSLVERGESAPEPPASAIEVPSAPPAREERPAIVTPPPVDPRVETAKKALGDLAEGLKDCVKRSAMVLPGSSPAIPPKLEQAAAAGYEIQANDFKTPMWSCANFHVPSPLKFQVQWQLSKGGSEGYGVAWLDDDGDGRADRAFAFHAVLKSRGVVETEPVQSVPATRPVLPVSY